MPMAFTLDEAPCVDCGEDPVWWSEDETESTMEVYVTCRACGREYPKRFVSKTDDTSTSALKDIARECVR